MARKGLIDEFRETSLEIVAGLAESAVRATPNFDRGPVRRDEPRSDFLYDVVRLQLTHLNELARLGAAYSFLPARILERLYSGAGSYASCEDRSEERCGPSEVRRLVLEREARPGDPVTFSIPLRNACFNTQTLRVDRPVFHEVRTGKPEDGLVVGLFVNGKAYDPDLEYPLVQTATLQVRVAIAVKVSENKVFEAPLHIRFSDADSKTSVLRLHTLG